MPHLHDVPEEHQIGQFAIVSKGPQERIERLLLAVLASQMDIGDYYDLDGITVKKNSHPGYINPVRSRAESYDDGRQTCDVINSEKVYSVPEVFRE
jgi:hypothetical protein